MMPRHNPRKTAQKNAEFQFPEIVGYNTRRATLAGPAQLFSRQSVLPVVMLDTNEVKGKTGLLSAQKSPVKVVAKKAVGKNNPKAANSPKPLSPKQRLSPRSSRRVSGLKSSPKRASPEQRKSVSPKSKKIVKPSPKSKKKSPSPRKSRRTASVKPSPKRSSPKRKKSVSPKSTHAAKASPKAEKVPVRSSRRTASVVSSKHAPPKQKKLQKSTKESPVRHLPSAAPVSSPKPLRQEKAEKPSTQKTATVSRKRKRSVSPESAKKPKISAFSEKRSKLPVIRESKVETPLKPVKKRKREEDENKLSLPPKEKVTKSESKSAAKKATKKGVDKSFTEVKTVAGNAAKLERNNISATQQTSTPLKPKLSANDVSMNWSVSNIKRKLLASITPSRMRENKQTPVLTNAGPVKSALFSAKKNEGGSPEKRTTRRQSVRFKMNGKADTVKELKQRSSRKHLCYRVFKYLLLLGLPAAVTVASVLVYNGLI